MTKNPLIKDTTPRGATGNNFLTSQKTIKVDKLESFESKSLEHSQDEIINTRNYNITQYTQPKSSYLTKREKIEMYC